VDIEEEEVSFEEEESEGEDYAAKRDKENEVTLLPLLPSFLSLLPLSSFFLPPSSFFFLPPPSSSS
jgi:hypothetical protein